jgi:hypothetical protein
MKKFVAVFLGSPDGAAAAKWEALDEKTRAEREKAGQAAWGKWMMTHQKSIAQGGSPLGSTLRVDNSGVSKTQNAICAFTIVEAVSHQAAAQLFVGHPHFTIFPGDAVEIMECLPIPGM